MIRLKTVIFPHPNPPTPGAKIDVVKSWELHAILLPQLKGNPPFEVWMQEQIWNLPEYELNQHYWACAGDTKPTLIVPEMAKSILIISPTELGKEYRRYLITIASQFLRNEGNGFLQFAFDE